ncbi:MAG: hypothetical protein M3P50_03940 [Actinomycetota bacterium]|nr:hypothetical protein [Actinomycetota bacterium]
MSHIVTAAGEAQQLKGSGQTETDKGNQYRVDRAEVERLIESWPKAPQTAARQMLEQYAPPNEATPTKLWWYRNGPWKRTLLTSDEIAHNFPMPHTDFLTQYIDYRVPVDRVDDVTQFDGSCLVDRTSGEAAARCDSEAANVLTLNLMHDIVRGISSVERARELYAENMASYAMGRPTPYCETLQFTAPAAQTADLDEAVMSPGNMARKGTGKLKDDVLGGDDEKGPRTP